MTTLGFVWPTTHYHEASQNAHQIVVSYTNVVNGMKYSGILTGSSSDIRLWSMAQIAPAPLLVVHYMHDYSIQDMFANPFLTLPVAWHVMFV
jgi:hypothetical protein